MKATKEQIKALQDNEKPFGLMSAELQEVARTGKGLNDEDFERYCSGHGGKWVRIHAGTLGTKSDTYRLRPDHQLESSIVEIPVDPPSHSIHGLSFQKDDNIRPLYAASEYPDFIGFKYQDDTVSGFSRMYRGKSGGASFNAVPFENLDRYTVLHATHVLFQEVQG